MERLITVAALSLCLLMRYGVDAQPNRANESSNTPAGAERQAASTRLPNPPGQGDMWWMREGKGYTLCEALYAELQKFTPDEVRTCPDAIAMTLPGMSELSGWVDLDPGQHKDLYNNLMQYHVVGVRAYFGNEPDLFARNKYTPEALEQGYQRFLALPGARMRTLQGQFFVHDLGGFETYTTPQTIVEIRRPQIPEACPHVTRSPELVATYFTTPDLSGPDPRIPAGEVGAARSGRFVDYKGVIHLMYTSGSGILFYRDFQRGALQRFCEISPNLTR